jgi:hypothetical protein
MKEGVSVPLEWWRKTRKSRLETGFLWSGFLTVEVLACILRSMAFQA